MRPPPPALSSLWGGEGGSWNCSAHDCAADEIALLPVPDHLRAADAAERAQRGHEINRFEDVRLALRVVAEQQMEAGRKIRVQPRVIAEVAKSQMGQMHAEKIGARTARPRVFSQSNHHDRRVTTATVIWIIPAGGLVNGTAR